MYANDFINIQGIPLILEQQEYLTTLTVILPSMQREMQVTKRTYASIRVQVQRLALIRFVCTSIQAVLQVL